MKSFDELKAFIDIWGKAGCPGVLSVIRLPNGTFDFGLKKIVKYRECTDDLKRALKTIFREWKAGRYEIIARPQDNEVDRVEIYFRIEDVQKSQDDGVL